MSDWHEILTKSVNREKAHLMNEKDFRIKFANPSFIMNVQDKSYKVYGKEYAEDPFIALYSDTAEMLSKQEFNDISGFVEERAFYIANQALLAGDVVVLQSIFRLVEKCQDILDDRDFGASFMDKLFNPAVIHTFESRTRKEEKLFFFEEEVQFEEEIEGVKVEDDNHFYGNVEESLFRLLPGTYTFIAEIDSGEKQKEVEIENYERLIF